MTSEEDIFLEKMKGVVRLKDNNKIKKNTKKTNLKNILKNKKIKKTIKPNNKEPVLNKKEYTQQKTNINKALKRGDIIIDKRVDLHGRSVQEAEQTFYNIIIDSYKKNLRCILFITGKGLHNKENDKELSEIKTPKLFYGKIKAAVNDWAASPKMSKYILTTERANPQNGGDGAVFIYLRKQKP